MLSKANLRNSSIFKALNSENKIQAHLRFSRPHPVVTCGCESGTTCHRYWRLLSAFRLWAYPSATVAPAPLIPPVTTATPSNWASWPPSALRRVGGSQQGSGVTTRVSGHKGQRWRHGYGIKTRVTGHVKGRRSQNGSHSIGSHWNITLYYCFCFVNLLLHYYVLNKIVWNSIQTNLRYLVTWWLEKVVSPNFLSNLSFWV